MNEVSEMDQVKDREGQEDRNHAGQSRDMPLRLDDRDAFPAAVVFPLLASLIVKLGLLGFNRGEYTDGILQLTLFQHDVPYFPPFYTICCLILEQAGLSPLIAGQLVSILASSLVVIPLYWLAKILTSDRRIPIWTVWFYLVAPIQNRWAIRVMTDALFCALFVAALAAFVAALSSQKNAMRKPLLLCLFWAGLASLTRYHGLIFLPLMAWLIWRRSGAPDSREQKLTKPVSWAWIMPALLPWAGLAFWIITRGFGHGTQFAERATSFGWLNTVLAYSVYLEAWIIYLPWAITYPLAILALVGFFVLLKKEADEIAVARIILFLFAIWWFVQTAFQSFQYRYWLPLIPLFCLLGAYGCHELQERYSLSGGFGWPRLIVPLTLLFGISMTIAVWVLQRDSWANAAALGHLAAELPAETRLWSDEIYGSTAVNPKIRFYAGRDDILPIYASKQFGGEIPFADGDVLLLHPGAYSQMEFRDVKELRKIFAPNFTVDVLRLYRFRTRALLPDIMTYPEHSTSQPAALAYRLWPQEHWGIAIQLHDDKTSAN